MDKEQENQYRMGGQLTAFLTAQADRLKPSPAAVAEAADVQAAYAKVEGSIGQGTTRTTANTRTADTLQATVLKVLPALLGPLRSVARKLPDATESAALLARATVTAKQLDKLRPAPLRDVVKHLLADGLAYKTPLLRYGYTPAVHAVITGHFDAFAQTVGTTRTLISTSKGTHASTDDLLLDLMKQCYELDDAMNIFRVLDADLHRDYLTARRVGKSGGGGGKKKKDDGTPPKA